VCDVSADIEQIGTQNRLLRSDENVAVTAHLGYMLVHSANFLIVDKAPFSDMQGRIVHWHKG
jgi:hypothetical protein